MIERNITLDYFKLVLSILVVLIHMYPLLGDIENRIFIDFFISNGICRIAVPCFFLMNGYFLADKITSFPYVKKYIIKLLVIFIVWNSIYLYTILGLLENPLRSLLILIQGIFHLWYISGLILAVIIYFLLRKIIKGYKIIFIALFLFIVGYIIQYYYSVNKDMVGVLSLYKFRNGLFLGFPFLVLGNLISLYRNFVSKLFTLSVLSVFLVIFIFTFCLEINYSYQNDCYSDFYFSQLIICPCLLLLMLKRSKYSTSNDFTSKLSESIYFIHPMSLAFIFGVLSINPLNNNKLIFLPVVLFISAVLSVGIIHLNKQIKIFL